MVGLCWYPAFQHHQTWFFLLSLLSEDETSMHAMLSVSAAVKNTPSRASGSTQPPRFTARRHSTQHSRWTRNPCILVILARLDIIAGFDHYLVCFSPRNNVEDRWIDPLITSPLSTCVLFTAPGSAVPSSSRRSPQRTSMARSRSLKAAARCCSVTRDCAGSQCGEPKASATPAFLRFVYSR